MQTLFLWIKGENSSPLEGRSRGVTTFKRIKNNYQKLKS
jgi:hypothetical protein